MDKRFIGDSLGWGLLLWLIGYALGFAFFFFLPNWAIGWAIMPVGILITLAVLFKKVAPGPLARYAWVGAVWTLIAVVFDYIFLYRLLKPADGYYKLDVYIYYGLTFLTPLVVGWWQTRKAPPKLEHEIADR